MVVGDRLRIIREAKGLSQGDIEKRSGLKRSYISRVEGGHIIPSLETLEKFAHALEVPLYQLFYNLKESPRLPRQIGRKTTRVVTWGKSRSEIRFWHKLLGLLTRMHESDRRLLLYTAQKMAKR